MCGTKGRHDFVVMGHEVNMASRFMIGAKPGQVIASPRIKKATSDFIQYTSLTMPYYKNKPVETGKFDVRVYASRLIQLHMKITGRF